MSGGEDVSEENEDEEEKEKVNDWGMSVIKVWNMLSHHTMTRNHVLRLR